MLSQYSYYDFAENDRVQLESLFNIGAVSNIVTSSTQNCCEKYLKYIVETFYGAKTVEEEQEKMRLLKTHSLRKILRSFKEVLGMDVSTETYKAIVLIDGLYFTTRYPGDESFFATADDVKDCELALKACVKYVDDLIIRLYLKKVGSEVIQGLRCRHYMIDGSSADLLRAMGDTCILVHGEDFEDIKEIPSSLLKRVVFCCEKV